jgi:hypothetical protein
MGAASSTSPSSSMPFQQQHIPPSFSAIHSAQQSILFGNSNIDNTAAMMQFQRQQQQQQQQQVRQGQMMDQFQRHHHQQQQLTQHPEQNQFMFSPPMQLDSPMMIRQRFGSEMAASMLPSLHSPPPLSSSSVAAPAAVSSSQSSNRSTIMNNPLYAQRGMLGFMNPDQQSSQSQPSQEQQQQLQQSLMMQHRLDESIRPTGPFGFLPSLVLGGGLGETTGGMHTSNTSPIVASSSGGSGTGIATGSGHTSVGGDMMERVDSFLQPSGTNMPPSSGSGEELFGRRLPGEFEPRHFRSAETIEPQTFRRRSSPTDQGLSSSLFTKQSTGGPETPRKPSPSKRPDRDDDDDDEIRPHHHG